MATLPTTEQAERAILNVFKRFGTRPGESIKMVALMDLMAGSNPFRADDLNAALQAMTNKEWIEVRREGFYTLTELGFAAV
jgi:hypothetical protein